MVVATFSSDVVQKSAAHKKHSTTHNGCLNDSVCARMK